MGIEKKDPANFSPSVEIPAKVDSFRFWCQKVLPLVYDDSLSYYELLCKVVNYLNNTIADVNTLGTDVDNLNKAYNELQSYVNDYFSTLNVQDEINNKLDVMAQDGSLSALIQPLFDTYKTEIDNEVNQQYNKIGVLENRMDTFTSLPSGSTTGDAELIDIRVPASGFNNTPYPTAGDAVRGQVNSLKEDLVNQLNIINLETLFNVDSVINGYYAETFGNFVPTSTDDRLVTPKYDVEQGDYISYSGVNSISPNWQNAVFFGENDEVIEVFKPLVGYNSLYIPRNVKKISFGIKKDEINSFNLIIDRVRNKNFVTPEMFGAYGDSVHDDYIALRDTVSYSAKNKKIAYLNSSYLITNSINVPANARIEGCGLYKCFIKAENNSFAFTLFGGGVSINNVSIVGGHGISFGDTETRKTGTFISNMQMIDVGIAISIKCATGYNYFKNIHIRDRGTNYVIDLGDANIPNPYVNYVYFDDVTCEVNGHGHDFSSVNTCVNIKRAYYIYFNHCDFVGYNRAINLSGSKLCEKITITETTFFDCITDFYSDSAGNINYRDIVFNSCIFTKSDNMPDTSKIAVAYMKETARIVAFKMLNCAAYLPSISANMIVLSYCIDIVLDVTCNREINQSVSLNNCKRVTYQDSYTHIDTEIGENGETTIQVNTNKYNSLPIKNFTWCLYPQNSGEITEVITDKVNSNITFKGTSGYKLVGEIN